jgi:hypothetical protein
VVGEIRGYEKRGKKGGGTCVCFEAHMIQRTFFLRGVGSKVHKNNFREFLK